MDVVFNYIKSNPDQFDGRVYTEGFSQNSGMAAYVGYCFSDYVRGVWQAGAGSKPVEPCFTKKRPMIECIPDYTNDYRTHCNHFVTGRRDRKFLASRRIYIRLFRMRVTIQEDWYLPLTKKEVFLEDMYRVEKKANLELVILETKYFGSWAVGGSRLHVLKHVKMP